MTTSTAPPSNMLQLPIQATPTQVAPTSTPAQLFDGPITQSQAKKLQQEVNVLLCEIIYCLSHVHCYCSGSPRRMARIQKEKNIEKDHDRTRQVLQNSLKEAVITFDSQKV